MTGTGHRQLAPAIAGTDLPIHHGADSRASVRDQQGGGNGNHRQQAGGLWKSFNDERSHSVRPVQFGIVTSISEAPGGTLAVLVLPPGQRTCS